MNLEQAFNIVLNEAEISALGERTDHHLEVIKATEVLRSFYERYGNHFKHYAEELEVDTD
tara:strand:+ start:125 stop:304 length:180 start_codon:yes stop_codon:yes gene_type:complete